ALVYVIIADWRSRTSLACSDAQNGDSPAVSILKPLCGDEPRLEDSLRSFFELDYPNFQIIFGVRDSQDPALKIVDRLRQEYPQRDVRVVIAPRMHGMNAKTSNLINILGAASHDLLVIADSDIKVTRHYLQRVARPLQDPTIGAVTCPYAAVPSNRT